MNFNSCDFILSYIELKVSAPLVDAHNRVSAHTVKIISEGIMGDEQIEIDFLSDNIQKHTTFINDNISFILARDHEAGETILDIYPLIDNISPNTIFESLLTYQVYSINSLENTVDSNELIDRVFGRSIWTTNKQTNRIYNIVVSGIKIKDDIGLKYIQQSTKTAYPIYFEIWVEDNFILPVNGLAFVKNLKEARLIDNNIEISFELSIFKLEQITKKYIYTIASNEFDVIIGEELEKTYFLLSE